MCQEDKAAPEMSFPLSSASGNVRRMRHSIPVTSATQWLCSLAVRPAPPFVGARNTQIKQYSPCLLAAGCAFANYQRASTKRAAPHLGQPFISATRETKAAIHNQPSDPSLASGTHGL